MVSPTQSLTTVSERLNAMPTLSQSYADFSTGSKKTPMPLRCYKNKTGRTSSNLYNRLQRPRGPQSNSIWIMPDVRYMASKAARKPVVGSSVADASKRQRSPNLTTEIDLANV